MELAVLILVALSFAREARATSRSAVTWAIAGGALYACSLVATKALLYQLRLTFDGNSLVFMALDMFFSNATALALLFWCSRSVFGSNALKADQPFKVLNWIWLILALFLATGPMLNPTSLSNFGPQIIVTLAVAVLIPAGTLFAGKRESASAKKSSLKMCIPMLILNSIVAAMVIDHLSTSEVYHPIAFFIVDIYFSLWIIAIALFNAVVLFGIHLSSRKTSFYRDQQECG